MKSSKTTRRIVVFGGLLLALVLIVAGGFFVVKIHDSKDELPDITSKVGKLIQLPTNEEPTLATVSDKDKLKNQAFFSSAENGDKVLIYNKARKAYLYRPGLNKLVDVASVNLAAEPAPQVAGAQITEVTPTPEASPTPTNIRVAVYNGTKTPKLASKVETQLKNSLSTATVTVKDNAKDAYEITRVIDLKGGEDTSVKQLLGIVGGEAGILPATEKKPDADVLIILGTDFTKKQ